jgi:multicomponent K+:H+ antiporter subunit D
MTQAWLIAPVLLPLVTATVLLGVERLRPRWQGPLALAATLGALVIAVRLLLVADTGAVAVYLLGNWAAPFGIVLVLDRLSALLLVLTGVVALASLAAGLAIADRGPHFHAFFQFQLAGLNGAFLTGDLFNLFVFFEVLLIASYALLLHDARGRALRAGLHFVVINLVGSAFVLLAAGLLYGVTGTLNFADLAVRLRDVTPFDAGLARAAAMLLLVVFAIKAALLPLGFWLPETYAAAPGPVAVLFAVMTKVGVYGIVRVSMLLFGGGDGPLAGWGGVTMTVLGLATIAFGALAALAAPALLQLVGALVLVSSGTLIAAAALGTPALAGALYYLVHSALAAALLYLVAYAIARQRGVRADRFRTGPPVTQPLLLGTLFFVGAAAVAGLPPFAGFIGKVLMLQGTLDVAVAAWFWAAVLCGGLAMLFALARAGSRVFWKTAGVATGVRLDAGASLALAILVVTSLLWMVAAGGATRYAAETAQQLAHPAIYVEAVARALPRVAEKGIP